MHEIWVAALTGSTVVAFSVAQMKITSCSFPSFLTLRAPPLPAASRENLLDHSPAARRTRACQMMNQTEPLRIQKHVWLLFSQANDKRSSVSFTLFVFFFHM